MYLISIVILMVLGPASSVALAVYRVPDTPMAFLILRWAVVWMVGGRLFLAGVRQILQPQYTARTILGIEHGDSQLVVRELGFGNVALGTIGLASIPWPQWTTAAAVGGAIFYGLAGLNHLHAGQRTSSARIAMVSDLWAAAALIGCNIAQRYAG